MFVGGSERCLLGAVGNAVARDHVLFSVVPVSRHNSRADEAVTLDSELFGDLVRE